MTIAVGSQAVPFELPSTFGTASLAQYRGKPLLLSFYSMAFTPV